MADALGDPTRRAIFRHVTEADEALTASDVGLAFGVHRTVARAHLEKLVDSGLLAADFKHRSEGGRPPKVYQRSGRRLDLQLPVRHYELLSGLLLSSLEQFGEAAEVIIDRIGYDFGRSIAREQGSAEVGARLQPFIDAGAVLRVQAERSRVAVNVVNCIFRELATQRPGLVCALDRAILRGLLTREGEDYRLADVRSEDGGHHSCNLIFERVCAVPAATASLHEPLPVAHQGGEA